MSEDTFEKLTQKYESLKQKLPSFFEIRKLEVFDRISKLALKYTEK